MKNPWSTKHYRSYDWQAREEAIDAINSMYGLLDTETVVMLQDLSGVQNINIDEIPTPFLIQVAEQQWERKHNKR